MMVDRPGNTGGDENRKRSGEFELIRKLTSGGSYGREVIIGPGDDASAVSLTQGDSKLLLQTTDLLIEDVHFRRGWGTTYQLGWKSLAVNLSDIAAMGGRPLHAHLNLAIPSTWSEDEIMEFRRGFYDLAAKYNVALLGGDLSSSPGPLMISVMLSGEVKAECVLRRSGAKPGDVIWVSGEVGNAAAGLKLLKQGKGRSTSDSPNELIQSFLLPSPEVELGLICAESQCVTALIDLSDGLAGDLGHILEESRVGAVLEEGKLPVSDSLRAAAEKRSWNLHDLVLRGGEDYKLLGCSPKDKFHQLSLLIQSKLGRILFALGEITAGSKLKMRRQNGRLEPIDPRAFDHFA